MNAVPTMLISVLQQGGAQEAATVAALLSMVVATIILGFFDISLPRGDVIGVSGALDVVALALFGPVTAVFTSLIGILGAFVARRGVNRPVKLARTVTARLSALMVASLLFTYLFDEPIESSALSWFKLAIVIAIYLFVEFAMLQAVSARRTSRSVIRLLKGNALGQLPVMLAQWSAALLAVIVFDTMREWALLLVVVLLLLIRQSYVLLLEIRETYRTTVEVLVEAAEGVHKGQSGHSDRTARIARSIAERCGFSTTAIERVNYAALLHDLQLLASAPGEPSLQRASSILADITYFDEVTAILRVCDGVVADDQPSDAELLSAYIVALSSDIDSLTDGTPDSRVSGSATAVVTPLVPASLRAKAVGAAVYLGYRVPSLP